MTGGLPNEMKSVILLDCLGHFRTSWHEGFLLKYLYFVFFLLKNITLGNG